MSFIILLTTSLFVYHAPMTFAQLEITSEIIVRFNMTGINYPKDILFYLYTRKSGDNAQILMVNNTLLLDQSTYNTSLPTKFITHGWTMNYLAPSCVQPRRAFLQRGNFNVIVVDWSKISQTSYMSAATRVKAVGMYVSEMVKFLADQGSDVKQMTLVGHSLGAHVMGLAGYELSPRVGHIVGLDPARPGFELNGITGRLYNDDADVVENIHTNGGVLGFIYPIGDWDYFPNAGSRQPGCTMDTEPSCSHGRAYMYYSESITRPDDWYAVLCYSYTEFLAGTCKNNPKVPFPRWSPVAGKLRGNYMLRTNSSSLFGLGMDGTNPPKSGLGAYISLGMK